MRRSYKNLSENFNKGVFKPYRYEDKNQTSKARYFLKESAPILNSSSHPNGYTFEEILALIENQPKGQWFNIECRTDANNTNSEFHIGKQGKGHEVYKISTMQIRIGIKYKNQKIVQDLARKKIIHLTGKLAWAKWIPGYEGLFVQHRTAGGEYLMCFLGANKTVTRYFVDGNEVTKQELFDTGFIRPSYFNKEPARPLAMTPNIKNLIGMSIDSPMAEDDDVDLFALAGEDYFGVEDDMENPDVKYESLMDEAVESAEDAAFDKKFVEEISHYEFLSPEETEIFIGNL